MKDDTSFSRAERGLSRIFLIFFEHFLPRAVAAGQKEGKMKELTMKGVLGAREGSRMAERSVRGNLFF
jgi:hypothetical protein